MPKMKSKRGASKRFKVTGSGRIKRAKAYKSHMNRRLNQSQLRNLRKRGLVDKADEKRIREIIPYV